MSDRTHHQIARYIDGDDLKRYRELVIRNVEAGKQHRLELVLNDHESNWEIGKTEYIVLPLGKTESVPKESPKPGKPEEYANFTAPLVLKRYTTSDFDKSKADELRKGWIYIYLNGYLWRELMVGDGGLCKDVNLQRHQGKDFRKASGEADSRVIVPWKINNKKPTIEIAFSEVQWSWARINALGGMNPDTDFEKRLKPDTPLSTVSESDAADNRSARMLDITNELDRWILNDGEETENIQLVDDVKADIYTLQLNKQSKLPVVFLKDPLGIAKELSGKYQDACNDMIEYVKKLSSAPGLLQMETVGGAKKGDGEEDSKDDPRERQKILWELDATDYDPIRWFDSAQILNQFLYAKLPDTAPEELTDDEKDDFNKQIKKAKEKRKKYLEKINEKDLKTALRTNERKKIREDIVEAKGRLVEFLESELATQGEESSFLRALDDYFTLSAKIRDKRLLRLKKFEDVSVYADAWKVFSEIIQHLDKHEYAFDSELEPLADDGWTLRKKDGGVNLLIKIADPQENLPVHSRLFPKMAGADTPMQIDDTKIENGDPLFKADYFYNLLGDELDHALESIADFPDRFHEVIAMDDRDNDDYKKSIGRIRQSLCRFSNGIHKFEFEEVSVSTVDILEFKNIAIEDTGDQSNFQMYRRPTLAFGHAGTAFFKRANENLVDQQNSRTNIDLTTGSRQKITDVGTSRKSDYELENVIIEKQKRAKGKGNPDVFQVTSDVGDDVRLVFKKDGPKLNKNSRKVFNYRVKAVMVLNEEARKRLDDLIGKNEIRIKAFAQLLSVVETINALNAVNKVMNNKNDDNRAQLAAELVSSFCDAVVAVGETAKVVRNMAAKSEKMAVAGSGLGPKTGGFGKDATKLAKELPYLKIIGTISGLIEIHLSWKSMIENYRQNDDAYIGSAIMLSGFLLNTFAAEGIATFLGLASITPVTAVLAIVIFIGVLIFTLLKDTHFEKWLANGPFAMGNGTRDFWNNSSYKVYKRQFVNKRFVAEGLTLHRYLADDSHNTFVLATDNDGNLTDAYPTGRKLREENKRVYLKAGEHPQAKGDTLIGVIGRPYTPIPMMQPQVEDRFMGHTPGADPMTHVPASKPGLFLKSTPNPNQYPEYRYALWCEYPDEAYAALLDALYRPQVTLEGYPQSTEMMNRNRHIQAGVLLRLSAPYYMRNTSILDINLEFKKGKHTIISHKFSQEEIVKCQVGNQGKYEIFYQLPQIEEIEKMYPLDCIAKIRLDISGDGKIQLPHEPMFCDTDIETPKDGKAANGVQLPDDSRWIVAETMVPNAFVGVLIL